MVEVWVDPVSGRVKAVYENCRSATTVWSDAGYVKYASFQPWMLPMEQPAAVVRPTVFTAEDGREYVIDSAGKLKVKPEASP